MGLAEPLCGLAPKPPKTIPTRSTFCGLAYMGPHFPRPITSTLWFWLTFYHGPGGCLGPWAVALEQHKSLTLR